MKRLFSFLIAVFATVFTVACGVPDKSVDTHICPTPSLDMYFKPDADGEFLVKSVSITSMRLDGITSYTDTYESHKNIANASAGLNSNGEQVGSHQYRLLFSDDDCFLLKTYQATEVFNPELMRYENKWWYVDLRVFYKEHEREQNVFPTWEYEKMEYTLFDDEPIPTDEHVCPRLPLREYFEHDTWQALKKATIALLNGKRFTVNRTGDLGPNVYSAGEYDLTIKDGYYIVRASVYVYGYVQYGPKALIRIEKNYYIGYIDRLEYELFEKDDE
jgi:hypothetical protein